MKRIGIFLALLATVACSSGGGDSPTGPAAPTTGLVYWKIDAATCSGSGAASIQFFIDGSMVGTESLSLAAPLSKGYSTTATQHVLGARISNTGDAWANTTATVPAGGSFTLILPCS